VNETVEYRAELPAEDEIGTKGSWRVVDGNEQEARLTGEFLGSGSSRKQSHRGHPQGTWGTREDRCSACRWIEILIFREITDDRPTGRYLVVKLGLTEVPSEVDRYSFKWAYSADDVVVAVSTRGTPLTVPARSALARAAGRDTELREAYRAAS
jgi:hypothetical protein